jgi:hypothetical protein
MTAEERQLDRDLNRLERMLERCIEADKAARRDGVPNYARALLSWRIFLTGRKSVNRKSVKNPALRMMSLHVEPKMDYIALMHDVLLAFQS